jgi:periplasmic divalent cation tolerance protein
MSAEPLLVLCTCPDAETARKLANSLVEQGLAACVNVLPGVQSTYRWHGEVRTDTEALLHIKTTAACWEALEQCIKREHPAELPELIGIPITNGLADYLDWIRTETTHA